MNRTYPKDENNFLKKIGSQIRALRTESGLSQEELAFKCDLDRTYIGSVERGERNISILNLRKIAKALSININEIVNP
jgi:transcriptional regulator with XRE-family HTH domain